MVYKNIIIHSMTASHIDSMVRPYLFIKMLDSLVKNGIDYINISMSFDNKFNTIEKNNIIQYLKKKISLIEIEYPIICINIYYHVNREMTQFEHLQYLYDNNQLINNKYTYEINHYCLFIDDDDLLLRIPDEILYYSILCGIAYCPSSSCNYDKTEKMTYNEILNIEDKYKDIWKLWNDFSGYLCQLRYLVNYFTRLRKLKLDEINKINLENNKKYKKCLALFNSLEDIDFMNYLDNMNSFIKIKPFIFHRLWCADDLTQKTWLKRINNTNNTN